MSLLPPAVIHGRREIARTTDKFGFIDTLALLPMLEAAGFEITRSSQVKRRPNSPRDPLAAKHLLRLRRKGIAPLVGDTFPEIVLVNAHDGSSAFKLMLGLFRLACANGLIVQSAEFAPPVKLTHTISNAGKVLECMREIQSQAREAGRAILNMQARTLNYDERLRFAEQANDLLDTPMPNPAPLLNARRQADLSKNLWTIFNVVQENILKGGIAQARPQNLITGRYRYTHTRPIRSVDGTVGINTKLWNLAERYLLTEGGQ